MQHAKRTPSDSDGHEAPDKAPIAFYIFAGLLIVSLGYFVSLVIFS